MISQTVIPTGFEQRQRHDAARLFSLIGSELAQVEAEFARQAQSNVQIINSLNEYLQRSGGKRVRPALLLLSCYATGGDASRHNAIRMAAVMEFLHTATLVHDDIIDNAQLRRDQPSVNERYGNQIAVLLGDWLYMTAFETSLAERSLEILDVLTSVTRRMVEGELLQLSAVGDINISEQTYFDILRRKTAYLFSACCEIGAILSGADEARQASLRDYGMNLGTAFQLADDLLDFTETEETLGKPAGVDLPEGKITLPLIYLLEREPSIGRRASEIIQAGAYTSFTRGDLIEVAQSSGALDEARNQARLYADTARRALDRVPFSDYTEALRDIPDFIVERER